MKKSKPPFDLHELRKSRGMEQKDVADKMSRELSYVRELENTPLDDLYLSELLRYCFAIGATLEFKAIPKKRAKKASKK